MDHERLLRRARRRPVIELGPATRTLCLGRSAIRGLIPHRPPFLLLDSLDHFDPVGSAAAGSRRIDAEDPILKGHFPGAPVYPGVLLLEMLGQLGLCLNALLEREADPSSEGANLRLIGIHGAAFPREVLPGDELSLLAHVLDPGDYAVACLGQVISAGEVRAAGILEILYVDPPARARPQPQENDRC